MKIVAIVLNNELISATLSEGVTDVTSSEAAIYIDTPENILTILTNLGVEYGLEKLSEFIE